MNVIKTNKILDDLDLGRFSKKIDKSKLILNDDGTYDYDGNLYFESMDLESLTKIPIRFRKVNVSFDCSYNKLTSLKDAPSYIGKGFYCNSNLLTSLKGSPPYVAGDFYCSFNYLISLQYAPLEVGGKFGGYLNLLLSKECLSVVKDELNINTNPFEITDGAIQCVEQMTYEQQMEELKFFDENDFNASKMFQEILNDLGVEYGSTNRKNIIKFSKDLNLKHLGI